MNNEFYPTAEEQERLKIEKRVVIERPDGNHELIYGSESPGWFAKHYFNGKWAGFLPQPDSKPKKRKGCPRPIEVMLHRNLPGEPFCFCCRRKKEELYPWETLTVDHIFLASEYPELEKNKDNMQILCTECEKVQRSSYLKYRRELKHIKEILDAKRGEENE